MLLAVIRFCRSVRPVFHNPAKCCTNQTRNAMLLIVLVLCDARYFTWAKLDLAAIRFCKITQKSIIYTFACSQNNRNSNKTQKKFSYIMSPANNYKRKSISFHSWNSSSNNNNQIVPVGSSSLSRISDFDRWYKHTQMLLDSRNIKTRTNRS